MKTTILLCALATIAKAIPTNHHETLQEEQFADRHHYATLPRERKSPLPDHHAAGLSTEAGTEDIHTQSTSNSGHQISPMEGRSLGFKKPIIVKKKIGYHVYRDSEEEMAHADPHENCRKQVNVKLCVDEPGSPKSMGNCFALERLNEEKEIENSIKTAKEAVENLQRGFNKMEHNSAKLAKTEDKELEDDIAVHQHIEAARKALEHVHQNFGHLDTLNLQATSPKTEDFHLKSSDEERLAQWKEAIDNIQKNFEIARNIEDALKADSEHTNLQSTHVDESSKIRESEHTESNLDSQLKLNPISLSNVELLTDESDALTQKRENSEVDMFTAPTEQKELKIKLHSDSLINEKIIEEPLGDREGKAVNTKKSNEHMPTMKNSEITTKPDETLKTGVKSEKDVIEHIHDQQSKAANDVNFGIPNMDTLQSTTHDTKLITEKNALTEIEDKSLLNKDTSAVDQLTMAKSAHIDQPTSHHEHDMSMEGTHESHAEMKNSVDNDLAKSSHKEVLTAVTMPFTDQSLKSKSVHEVDKNHKEEKIEPNNNNHEFLERMSDGVPTHTQVNTKHIEPTPIRETGFINGQQTIKENVMRMFEDENMEHKLNEIHRLNDHPITEMRMTEDQKYHAFLMRLANENQLTVQESPLSLSEDFNSKIGDFHNGQHFHDVHPSMRLSQDHNTENHFTENHEQEPLLKHWTHEEQQTPTQIAKTAAEFHETMKLNQHQSMQNQVTDDHNLHDLFLMRLAQENQQNEHHPTTPEFHNGHLHEILPQNRFVNNLANAHDMSQTMSLRPRMHEHLHMKHAMPSDMDSSMQPSMHVSMRDSLGKPAMEHKDMHWNHQHHAMARYGSGLPVTSASSGAVGLFPNANTGGCGIPLMLSCSPNVVSGTLAKAQPHPGTMTPPAYRSGDDLMYYMKRDAKDANELPTLKIQKTSIPFNHKPELVFEKA